MRCAFPIGRLAWALFLPVAFGLPAPLAAASGPEQRRETREDYRVQPGDVIEVRLWNEENDVREFTVSPEGNVSYKGAGVFYVKGLTIREITERVTQGLRRIIKNPQVEVSVKAFAPPSAARQSAQRVYVLGAVNKPGVIAFAEGMTVIDALTQAGGLAPSADGAQATLNSAKKDPLPVDLDRLLMRADMSFNYPLAVDDVLHVPARAGPAGADAITVIIAGNVLRPGAHRMAPGTRLSQITDACGGPTAGAALNKATISRAGLTQPVDLEAIFRQGDLTQDMPLRDGDVLRIPDGGVRVKLVGEFQKQGSFPFGPDAAVMDAIAAGGGPTASGDTDGMVLKRGSTDILINYDALTKQGDLKDNLPLQDGDVLMIPRGTPIYVYGAVAKPGPLFVKRSARLIDALFEVGGPVKANLKKAGLVREVDGKVVVEPIDLDSVMRKGGEKRNLTFLPRDVLVIPSQGERINWQGILGTLWTLQLLGLNPLK